MKTVVLLFTYKRSEHTKKVIDALKKNKVLPQKLLIFQDGLKKGDNYDEWRKVNNLFHDIDWCDKEIIVSDYNKGLAGSIVSGINYAFKESGADSVIVLEDDCVPTANFIGFMNQCFEKYEDDRRIYSVSGYSWPIELEKDGYDVYGCGRISTWGWGTWRNRWEEYKTDYDTLKRLKQDRVKSQNLALWGSDIEQMLIAKLIGENDSWAVYWGLHVIEKNGVCIAPYHSLIQNIGMDGTGVHCGVTDRFQVDESDGLQEKFELPDRVCFLEATKRAFADLYGSYSALDSLVSKEPVLIYGLGNYYLENEKEINNIYDVEAFIDRRKEGWFAGKEIICLNDVNKYPIEKIIIMIRDIKESIDAAKTLIELGVNNKRIIFGHAFWGKYSRYFERMDILPDGNLFIKVNGIVVKACPKNGVDSIYETLVNQVYRYSINNNKKDIVIDVGMGIGDSALFFLSDSNVERVIGFESSPEKIMLAKENLYEYLEKSKIEMYQYGYADEQEEGQFEKVAEVLKRSILEYSHHNFILKLNNKAEEYAIINKLAINKILGKIQVIMCKRDCGDIESILRCLEEEGFSFFIGNKKEEGGFVYAYNQSL